MKENDAVRILEGDHKGRIGTIDGIYTYTHYDKNILVKSYIKKDVYLAGLYREDQLETIGDKKELEKAVKTIKTSDEMVNNVKNGIASEPVNLDSLAELSAELEKEMSIDNDQDGLEQLKEYVKQFKEQEARLAFLEKKTKEQKEIYNRLSQALIPDLLAKYNLDDIKLKDTGEKIEIKMGVSVSIKNETEFYKYLADNEEDDIIKNTFVLYNPTKELKKIIKDYINKADEEEISDMEYEEKRGINTNTLKAYCRKKIEKGVKNFPPKSINVFTYKSTKIK